MKEILESLGSLVLSTILLSISSLISLSAKHRLLKQSFVVVSSELKQDDFEDDFSVVPTLQEAHDYIEMELIQRELGF